MIYSTQLKFKKYVKGYDFLSFARKFGDTYRKKLMNTATKTRMDAAKIASKRVVQKTVEAIGKLIGNKIADRITSLAGTKSKEKKRRTRNIHTTRKKTANC